MSFYNWLGAVSCLVFFLGLLLLPLSSKRKVGKLNEHKPERQPGEKYEDFVERRKLSNLYIKYRQQGIDWWKSSLVGTYRKKDYEPTKG